MPSKFAAMAARAGAAVDRTFGEDFDYLPYVATDPNARAVVDGSRAVTRIKAAYSAPHARATAGPARHPSVELTRGAHATNRPSAEFDIAQLPYEVRHGDRLKRIDTGVVYIISEPRRNGMGRVIVDLNQG